MTQTAIPSEMHAVVLDSYHDELSDALGALRVARRPVPVPGPGEVLVRMARAPCNPSDLLLLRGRYGVRKALPAVPGWEGAGTVVAHGGGLLGRWLLGKRVACGGQADGDGTWAEYFRVPARQCVPLPASLDFEQGASSLINPMTCVGLLDLVRQGRYRAAIQTAAAGQVGRMLIRLCRKEGVPLISIVRKPAQVDELAAAGAGPVLSSAAADFPERLRAAAAELGAGIAFDAVGGEMTGTLLQAMPERSEVVVYGALSDRDCSGLDPIGLIFRDQRVRGFYLGHWLRERGALGSLLAGRKAQSLIASGELRTEVAFRIPLQGVPAGLREYVGRTSEGKAQIVLGKASG
jgi:NADPH:quinone reductase-like Zn-dependent oxidoreductase